MSNVLYATAIAASLAGLALRRKEKRNTKALKLKQRGFRHVVLPDTFKLGENAAIFVADTIRRVVSQKGYANVIFATGASQFNFINYLISIGGVPWDKVTAYHLDEYVGLSGGEEHPASFRKYLKERLFDKLQPTVRTVHYLHPENYEGYEQLLKGVEIDLACIGIGENGHIAFNDPPVANFNDPKLVKIVEWMRNADCSKLEKGGLSPSRMRRLKLLL